MHIGDKVVIRDISRIHGLTYSGPLEIIGETKTLWKVGNRSFLKSTHNEYGCGTSYGSAPKMVTYVPERHDPHFEKQKIRSYKLQALGRLRDIVNSMCDTDMSDEFIAKAEELIKCKN